MISSILCSLALLTMAPFAGETSLACVPPEEAYSTGWYNGYEDRAYVTEGLGFSYTREVLWHELAHAWDLKKGTELNGYPSFFSETHTGFDLEAFARLQTLHLGVWPSGEVYPDPVPSEADWAAMEAAGWLMEAPEPQPFDPAPFVEDSEDFSYHGETSAEEVTIWSTGP